MKKIIYLIYVLILCFFVISCNISPDEDDNDGVRPEPFILPKYFDSPAWHPEGTWIAAYHYDSLDTDGDGRNDDYFVGIWLVHSETGTTQPLIRGFGNPAWSSDGTQLVMEAGGQIFTIKITSLEPVEVDTNTLFQLTFEGRNYFPDWSPNGKWIVYDSDIDDTKYDIWIMDSDGGNKKNVSGESDSLDQGGWRIPNWSPDGKYIVHERYVSGGDSGPEIVIMDTMGQNPVYLTLNNERSDQYPRYSPDGTRIAWYTKPRVGPPAIWVLNSDSSNLRKVSPDYAWRSDWSPDGSQLVFLYLNYENRDHPGNGELWLINVDGSGLRQLTYFKDNSL
ncbi:MAG: PD40 domain-containing protein [Candidatus Marinimicrobia bacterium]|nr:PD40 domain-containing protein [Candidatus Neomarinimicrobiota bacterium]